MFSGFLLPWDCQILYRGDFHCIAILIDVGMFRISRELSVNTQGQIPLARELLLIVNRKVTVEIMEDFQDYHLEV
jgi:hypothetical protein